MVRYRRQVWEGMGEEGWLDMAVGVCTHHLTHLSSCSGLCLI